MYCPYPYGSIHINPAGKIRPCCRFNGYLENDQGNLILKDIFYGDNMSELRSKFSSIKKEEFTESCFRCLNEENLGSKSLREKYPFEVKSTKLEMVELLFSNVCNYKCLPCNSSLSSRWKTDDKILLDKGFKDRIQYPICELDNIIYDGIDSIKLMKITGGEPFLYKRFEENLNSISDNNTECSLWIYTNGSIFPDKSMIKTLKRFKQVSIAISIDGIGKVNEYIRYGCNWKQTEENITLWKETGFDIYITSVISAYSLPKFKHLLDWWGPGHHIFIYLQKPPYLNINVLSRDIIDKAINDLKDYDLPFMSIIKNTTCKNDKDFRLFTETVDQLRGNSYESIL